VSALRFASIGVLAVSLTHGAALADDITGAGSTFVSPVLTRWSAAYSADGRPALAYQPIGSGGGIAALRSETVDFAATDAPLRPAELQKFGLAQFPLVVGGVVPIVNIAGVKPGELRFTGALLADIYLGKLTKWNDARITALNPGLKLPAAAIIVAHRVDASGTTFNWASYLAKASAEWRDKVGEGLAVAWPVGVGGKGNEGVAGLVKQTPGTIGYVELIYAIQNKIPFGSVQNHDGEFLQASLDSVTAAAASASKSMPADFRVSITNAPGKGAYPISSFTWLLFYENPKDKAKAKTMVEFMKWALTDGQKYCAELGYSPLPKEVVALEMEALKKIKL